MSNISFFFSHGPGKDHELNSILVPASYYLFFRRTHFNLELHKMNSHGLRSSFQHRAPPNGCEKTFLNGAQNGGSAHEPTTRF